MTDCDHPKCREEIMGFLADKLSKSSLRPLISVAVLIIASLIVTWSTARQVPDLAEKAQIRETRITRLEERFASIMTSQSRIEAKVEELQSGHKSELERVLMEIRTIMMRKP